jgi:hypothetical protein
MRKLTLVSISSNGKKFTCFLRCVYENDKAILTLNQLKYLQNKVGATDRGVTFTMGVRIPACPPII